MSNQRITAAFRQQVVVLPIQSIIMQREIEASYRKSAVYLQISASLEHVGLIEPVVVFPRGPNEYLLLDGHVRLDILKQTGKTEVPAIFATDDEAYTYNKRVNHAPPVAQHFMIRKALKNGVSEERLASALNVDIGHIRKKRDMLDGICPEVVDILRDSPVTADAFVVLRKMKPIRQIEAAEHMFASGTYSVLFAKALLEVTRPELLVEIWASRKLDPKPGGARVMLEQETDFSRVDPPAQPISRAEIVRGLPPLASSSISGSCVLFVRFVLAFQAVHLGSLCDSTQEQPPGSSTTQFTIALRRNSRMPSSPTTVIVHHRGK